jgi:hypothetical protein
LWLFACGIGSGARAESSARKRNGNKIALLIMDVSPPEFESERILRPRQEIRYQQKVLSAPDGVELFPPELS